MLPFTVTGGHGGLPGAGTHHSCPRANPCVPLPPPPGPLACRLCPPGAQLTTLCFFFCSRCDLCCCLIPCLFDDFKDVTHTCPNCKAYIYTYKRMC